MTTKIKPVKNVKKEQVIEQLDKIGVDALLGKIANWNLRRDHGKKHKHSEVVSALQKVGLDDKIAKEFAATTAFNRAITKLEKEERIIDVIRYDKDEILFQFT